MTLLDLPHIEFSTRTQQQKENLIRRLARNIQDKILENFNLQPEEEKKVEKPDQHCKSVKEKISTAPRIEQRKALTLFQEFLPKRTS